MEIGEIIALIIVGALAGTAAASMMGMRGKSSRLIRNTIIGIIGALVGGFLFELLDISLPEVLDASISLADVIVAFIGAVLVIFVWNRIR
jgi:uncharacterized membrane protein YeaQ/YmgE (transglycosylase-associated protein family)